MIVWAKVGGILVAVLLVFFTGYHFGGMAPKLSEARAVERQQVAEQRKDIVDESTIAEEAKRYAAADIDPIPSPVVRMCYSAPAAAVPGPNPAGPGTHATPVDRVADPLPRVPGPDIGPALLRAAHLADVQVAQLQDYVTHVCQAKAP